MHPKATPGPDPARLAVGARSSTHQPVSSPFLEARPAGIRRRWSPLHWSLTIQNQRCVVGQIARIVSGPGSLALFSQPEKGETARMRFVGPNLPWEEREAIGIDR